ncbi:DUF7347 domain-containing protein [Natronorarus salvus]|uniref:DUF7347 domain-containing protein n=1 Tax=Natronorarus salvus TaxID=3117733 RepID=UPI002F26D91B
MTDADPGPGRPIREALGEAPGAPTLPETFDLLADDTRLRVVEALYERGCTVTGETALSFSELRRLTDVRDTGRFNYHLGRLRGPFVRKTDRGYVLTETGEAVGAMIADSERSPPS